MNEILYLILPFFRRQKNEFIYIIREEGGEDEEDFSQEEEASMDDTKIAQITGRKMRRKRKTGTSNLREAWVQVWKQD